MAIARPGCCTSLWYRLTGASKITVKRRVDTDPSLVRRCQSVCHRRSAENLAFLVTRSIGECRMSLRATPSVVSLGGQPPVVGRATGC